MTLPASTQGPKAKLEWARQHINTLKETVAPFCDRNSYLITHEVDIKAGQQFWRFDSDAPEIPLSASLILGDALYNLRSALDHAIWQLVLINGNPPGTGNEFPIFKSAGQYETSKKSKLKGVSAEAVAMIDGMQPYNRGYRPLWALHRLNITDKHRHIYLTDLSMQRSRVVMTADVPQTINHGRVERGTKLLIVDSVYMDVIFEPSFGIAFSHCEDIIGAPVIDTIVEIEHVVDRVLSQLEFLN